MNTRYLIFMAFITAFAACAYADTQTTTLSWVVPSSVSHTLTYGGSCSTSAMYFVESNAAAGASPVDGNAIKIIPYDAASAGAACQDGSSKAAIRVTNGGNVYIDVNAQITTTLQAKVVLKDWNGDASGCGTSGLGGWEAACSKIGGTDATVPTSSTCVSIGDTAVQVLADINAGYYGYMCLAADFNGLSAGTTTDTLQTTAWESQG